MRCANFRRWNGASPRSPTTNNGSPTIMTKRCMPRGVMASAKKSEEEHILRCLRAALIMQWNTSPATLQRELFDSGGAMVELLGVRRTVGTLA